MAQTELKTARVGTPGEDAAELATVAAQAETNAGVARATGVLALGNIASRVLGLAREIVLSNLFGASGAVGALRVATAVPLAFYDLLIGGHVNSAIIPVLSEIVTRDGQKALWQLVSVLFSLVTAALAVLVLALEMFAPQVVLVAGGAGFDPQTQALAADLLRLTAPALLFMSLFAVLSGTLYALRVFTWPAFAGAAFNASIVLVMVLFAPPPVLSPVLNGLSVEWSMVRPAHGITVAAAGWLVGSLVQLVLQFPGMKDARLRFTRHWNHPAIRQIAKLYAPVMFSLVMDTLIIRPFSYTLAGQTGERSIGHMTYATTLIQFPHGLVATAISIAILPTLSRQVAAISTDGNRPFKDTLGLGLRLAATLILPATVGLFVLATPIVTLLFEHGMFLAHDTVMTVQALRLYLIGLPFAALDLLLVYAFYARQDTLTPALVGLVSLLVYMVVAILLLPGIGLFSLMVADSAKHVVHASLSAFLLNRRVGGLGRQRLLLTFVKTGLAALIMGVVAHFVTGELLRLFPSASLAHELAVVLLAGGVSVVVFLGAATVLRIEELAWLGGMLRQRLFR
ncbi:MAG: murein biosynthesis integral membrane protein MurJ [Chloroflexota bacterium]